MIHLSDEVYSQLRSWENNEVWLQIGDRAIYCVAEREASLALEGPGYSLPSATTKANKGSKYLSLLSAVSSFLQL